MALDTDDFVIEIDTVECKIENLGGVPWHAAPIPPRWHRCKPQTKGWVDYFTQVWRCACGAIRAPALRDGRGRWNEKNSRRRGR